MRRLAVLLSALAIASCAEQPPPPPTVPVATAAVAAPAAPEPEPAQPEQVVVAAVLPKGSALTASLDLSVVERALPEGTIARALSGVLGNGHDLMRGVDTSRPLMLGIAAPAAEARRAIAALRPLVPASEPGPVQGTVSVEALHNTIAPVPTVLAARLLVPAIDPAEVQHNIVALLEHANFKPAGKGAWVQREVRVALGVDGKTVVVDAAVGPGADATIAALRAQAGASHDEAPALEGRAIRLQYSPVAMAELSFLSGLVKVDGAISGESVDADQRARIAAQGLWEASRSFVLAGSDRGSYFDRVELSVRAAPSSLEAVITAETGPGFVGPKEEVWRPGPSIEIADTKDTLDIAGAFMDTWPLPGDASGKGDPRRFFESIKEAGAGGYFVALPSLLPFAGRELLYTEKRRLAPDAKPLVFERYGLFSPTSTNHETFFGIFPAKTSRAAAECALEEKTPCKGPRKLKVGGVTEVGSRSVRLVEVGGRIVMIAGNKDSVGVKVGTRTAGPLVFRLPLHEVLSSLDMGGKSNLPNNLLGSVEREGKALVLRMKTP